MTLSFFQFKFSSFLLANHNNNQLAPTGNRNRPDIDTVVQTFKLTHRRWRPCTPGTLALRKVEIHGNGLKLSAMSTKSGKNGS